MIGTLGSIGVSVSTLGSAGVTELLLSGDNGVIGLMVVPNNDASVFNDANVSLGNFVMGALLGGCNNVCVRSAAACVTASNDVMVGMVVL